MSGSGEGDLLATNAAFPAPFYIGTTSNATLAPGSPTTVGFGNVIKTSVHSPPVLTAQQESHESDIWTVDTTTMQLKVHYVNPDGSTANTIIAYNNHVNSIIFIGDVDAYNAAHPNDLVSPVTFYLDI